MCTQVSEYFTELERTNEKLRLRFKLKYLLKKKKWFFDICKYIYNEWTNTIIFNTHTDWDSLDAKIKYKIFDWNFNDWSYSNI